MVTEDYCSYEISKLLEEKGFDENCAALYDSKNEEFCEKQTGYVFNNSQWENFITAPTHQMAIKWLREIHKILISFNASFVNSIEPHFSWKIRINSLTSLNDERHFEPVYIHVKSESSEEACEAVIKYCLENLI